MNYRSLEDLFWERRKKKSGPFSCAIKAPTSGKYGLSHYTAQHPLPKLSSNMEKKNQNSKHYSIKDTNVRFFHLKTLLKTGILPMHQTILESVTYFEETAPLPLSTETLPTQR